MSPSFKTDDQGEFRYVVPSDRYPSSLSIYRTDPDPHRYVDQAWRLDVRIPSAENVGLYDLGDIYMKEVPTLVAGSVTNEQGRLVPGVTVFAEVKAARQQGAARLSGSASDVKYRFYTTTGKDGRFELYTDNEIAEGTLTLVFDGFKPTLFRPFVNGQRDVCLVITKGCQLRGRLLLGDGFLVHFLQIVLHGPDHARLVMLGVDDRFHQDGLAPGDYSIEIRFRGEDAPLHRQDVRLLAEHRNEEGGGITIDLRGKVTLCRIEVVAEDGHPIRGAKVICESTDLPSIVTDQLGRACVPSVTPTVTCVVRSEGYRHRLVTLGGGVTTVRMERGSPLRIQISADGLTLPRGLSPVCGITYSPGLHDELGAFRHGLKYPVQKFLGEDVEWVVAERGDYVLQFGVEMVGSHFRPVRYFADSLSVPVAVVESSDPKVVSVRITRDQLEEAIQRGSEASR